MAALIIGALIALAGLAIPGVDQDHDGYDERTGVAKSDIRNIGKIALVIIGLVVAVLGYFSM